MSFLSYLMSQFANGAYILFAGFLAWLFVAFLLQFLANSYRGSLSRVLGSSLFCYVTAPGTAIHELGHALFCVLFLHRVTDLRLFHPQGDELGHVSHTYNPSNYYQRVGNFFIGTGPVWLGLFVLYVISFWLLPARFLYAAGNLESGFSAFGGVLFSLTFWCDWRSWLWFYLAFTVVSHITLSTSDLQGAKDGFILIVIGTFLATVLFGWLGNWPQTIVAWELNWLRLGVTLILLPVIPLTVFAVILWLLTRKRRG